MNPKFSLKVIQQGQTQKVHVITPGAGLQGQALVVQAKDATRYQLADIVTLSTPEKLQMKRVGGNLHIALPGGDADAPDIVIEDYYNVRNATVQGQTLAGEWRGYTTANLVDTAAAASAEQGALASGKGWFSSLWGNTGAQSVGMASMDSSALSSGAGSSAGFAGMSMGTLAGVGALGALALGGGGGGGGGGSSADTSALGVIKAYASSGGGSAAPTDKTYSDSTVNVSLQAITANSTTVAAAEVLKFFNAAIALKPAADVDSASKIQSLYNSMASSLSNLLKVANGSTSGPASDSHVPTAADYLALGVKVDDAIGASGSNKTLDLLNAALADLNAVSVDTLAEVKKLASTANDVMKLAIGSSATQSDVDLIEGLNSLLGFGAASVVTTSNLSEMKAAIKDASTVTDGSDFATVTQLKTVVQTQVLKSYANASNGVNAVAPSLQTYKDAGLKVLSSLSDTDTNGTYDLVDNKSQVLGVLSTNTTTPVTESVWLGALNSGLDRLSSSSATFVADVQKMINSYYRILAEADGVVNTTTNLDVYPAGTNASSDDPLRSDYTNIGVQVGNAKSLDLLNDYVGQASDDKVDTVEEINVIAKAAYNVMRKAGVDASTLGGVDAPPGEYSTTDNAEWIAGLNKLLGLDTGTGANSSNIVAIKTAISGHADGTAVDTVRKVQGIVSLSRMKAFTDDPTAFASKSTLASAPTLADWGTLVTANKTLADATRVDLNTAAYWKTTNPFNGLTALNSALDTYTLTGTQATDVDKLQAIADSYGRILQEADGSRSTNTDVSSVSTLAGLTGPDLVVADLDNIGAALLGTATVDSNTGVWSYTVANGLGQGSHVLRAQVEIPTGPQARLVSGSFTLQVSPQLPTQTVAITQVGGLATDGASVGTQPAMVGSLNGLLNAGDQVAIYDTVSGVTSRLGYATVNAATGSWTFTPSSALAVGAHSFQAAVENGTGRGSYSTAWNSRANTLSVANLNEPTPYNLATNVLAGSSATPTITGSLGTALYGNEQLAVYDGATYLGTATVSNGTSWSFTPVSALSNGLHNLSVRIEDAAHVARQSQAVVYSVGPVVPTTTLLVTTDTTSPGVYADAVVDTDDRRPVFSGTLSQALASDQMLAIYDGVSLLGTATVNGTSWTFEWGMKGYTGKLSTLDYAYGSHPIRAVVQSNVSGTQGTAATATVNINALNLTAVNDDVGGIQGNLMVLNSLATAFATDDTTPQLQGTLKAALTGTEQVAIYDGTSRLGTASITGGTNWSYNASLAAGTHVLKAVIEESGTQVPINASDSYTVTVSGTPASTIGTAITSVSNTGGAGGLVSDGGTAATPAVVLSGTVASALGASYQVGLYDGNVRLGTANLVDPTHWQFATGNLGRGSHTLAAKVETLDGLAGSGTAGSFTVSVAASAPTQTVSMWTTSTVDTYDNPLGSAIFGTLSDSLGANEVVAVYEGSTKLGTANVTGTRWTMPWNTPLAYHTYQARVEDTSTQLTGDYSASVTYNNPVAAPTIAITESSGIWQGTLVQGGVTDTTSVTIAFSSYNNPIQNTSAGGAVVIYDNGSYSGYGLSYGGKVTVPFWGMTQGAHRLEAFYRPVDTGEGFTGPSAYFDFTVSSPLAELVSHVQDAGGVKTVSTVGATTLNLAAAPNDAAARVDRVDMSDSGATTTNLTLANVLRAGTDLFNAAKGWTNLTSGGRHQMLIDGDIGDKLQLDTPAQAGNWSLAGVTTNGGHTYNVYNHGTELAQVIVDQTVIRLNTGAVL